MRHKKKIIIVIMTILKIKIIIRPQKLELSTCYASFLQYNNLAFSFDLNTDP